MKFWNAKRKRKARAEGIRAAWADGRLCGTRIMLTGFCTQPVKHQGPCMDNREWTVGYIEHGTRL